MERNVYCESPFQTERRGRAILAQAKFNKLEGRSQLREAKLEELSLEIRDNLLIPSSLRLLS